MLVYVESVHRAVSFKNLNTMFKSVALNATTSISLGGVNDNFHWRSCLGDLEDVKELVKMLKSRGYSDKAIKEVLKWYSTSLLEKAQLSR